MKAVYLVQHERSVEVGGDVKIIGVFSSRESADAAVATLCDQPGFREETAGFHVEPYDLDHVQWSEGFVDL